MDIMHIPSAAEREARRARLWGQTAIAQPEPVVPPAVVVRRSAAPRLPKRPKVSEPLIIARRSEIVLEIVAKYDVTWPAIRAGWLSPHLREARSEISFRLQKLGLSKASIGRFLNRDVWCICQDIKRHENRIDLRSPPTVNDVVKAVADARGIDPEGIMSTRRARRFARARQISMYLLAQTSRRSLPEIGDAFRRDHTTALHGIRKIGALIKSDPAFASEIETLMARITA